jgi:hypothetical protein
LEQDRNRIVGGQRAIPEAGRTRTRPSPTPGQGPAAGARPLPSPTPSPPFPPPQPPPTHVSQRSAPHQSALSTMSGMSRTVVKKTRDAALEHVRKALRNRGSLPSRPEASFIRTSCHILGLDGKVALKAIAQKAKEKGGRQPRKVLDQLQFMLMELAERVDKHKRPTPNPAASTRAVDSMGAPARSLAHLQSCADALREATEGQYSKGIKAAKKAMGNAKSDLKATIDRVAEASRWKKETIDDWLSRGKLACGKLMEKAEEALKEAEARKEAEAKIRIMEGQCEELAVLAKQAGSQIPAEAEVELLVDLEEEIGQRKEIVEDLGRELKETVPEELKGRVEEAIKESVMMAKKGRRYVDHVKTRLEFGSKDPESSSYKDAAGAAPGRWQMATEELGEESESEDEADGPSGVSSGDLLDFMRGFGHMQANDSGWPVFDGRYATYLRFKKEWRAYREIYHSAVNNDLAARALRDKCVKGDALRMISHLDDLREIWETLDTCYERPEKYMEEALRPVVDFRRYKITDNAAVREFYSLLRVAIKGAKGIGRLSLLINDQMIPKIMSKMPYADWKEWATKRPDWMQQDLTSAFERFVERKWQDALNVAAAEPPSWSVEREKFSSGGGTQDRVAPASKGVLKVTGAVNVVEQKASLRSQSPTWDVSFGRKCRARDLIGCEGDHVLLQCSKLLGMKLSKRKEVLEKSGLCLFCLKHAAELECYGQGGLSKPRCTQAGCDGEHTPGVHELLGEEHVGVNLVAEGECESDEDKERWVGVVRMEEVQKEEVETLEEIDEPETEREARYITSVLTRKGDSGLEDEVEYLWEAHALSSPGGLGENR